VPSKKYHTYKCLPSVSSCIKSYLTLNIFKKGRDGNDPPTCDNEYYSDDTMVVSLSTGWFNTKRRCLQNITISGIGQSAVEIVVGGCNSSKGVIKRT